MTDAPERIWAWGHPRDVCSIGEWQDLPCDHTEYVRADLATPLDDPRVKALVEGALNEAERMLKHYGSRDAGGMAQIRAALEAIASPSIAAPLDDPRVLALVEAAKAAEAVLAQYYVGNKAIAKRKLRKALSALEKNK